MHLFLSYKKTQRTGKVLAQALGMDFGVQIRVQPAGTLLRWGNAAQFEFDRGQHVVNKASAISHAGDKLRTLETLRGAGISVPDFQETPFREGEYLARKRRGFGGRDITVCDQPGTYVQGAEFYSRYIPNDREYRIHVVGGEVVRLQRKYPAHPGQDRFNGHVKNHANGYVFMAPRSRLRPGRIEAAVAAVEALGLDFGAVDAVVDAGQTMYVLEVNTAPACSPLTAQAYINALRKCL